MTRSLALEDFAPDLAPSAPESPADPAEAESARLSAYEEGYTAGWRDATEKAAEERARLGEEFVRNLRDLGFTYHEARAHTISAMEGLLQELVDSFFPALMSEALGHRILELLQPHIEAAADTPVRIRAAPVDTPMLREFLDQAGPVPFAIEEEPSMAEGQVHCVLGAEEHEIDLAGALDALRGALGALHEITERTLQNA